MVAVLFQPPPLCLFSFSLSVFVWAWWLSHLAPGSRLNLHSPAAISCAPSQTTHLIPIKPFTTAYQRRLHNLSAPDRCLTHSGITPSLLSIIQLFPQTLNVLLTCFFLCSRITLRPPSCHHQPDYSLCSSTSNKTFFQHSAVSCVWVGRYSLSR